MPNSSNATILVEQAQIPVAYELMTDSGDNQTFNNPQDLWSIKNGSAPTFRPDGIVSGRNVVRAAVSGTNDLVDTVAHTSHLIGVVTAVSANTDESITRPVTDVARINSVTVTSAGAIAVIAGTSAVDTVFVETPRGAAGSPPFIPVGSYEIAQVRLTTSAPAPIAASEIFQVPGTHAEYSTTPSWDMNETGEGISADSAAEETAFVKMVDALPLIHTGSLVKGLYLEYSYPSFGELSKAFDFVPVETTYSQGSTQVYRQTVGDETSALSAGSFSMFPANGITDALVADKGEKLTSKFFQDKDKTPFIISQGTHGIVRSFGADTQVQVDVTITSAKPSAEFSG